MINQEIFKGKWMEFKGGVRNIWGRLSEDDVEKTKGNLTSLVGLVQTKYGETKDTVKSKLDRLLTSFDNETDRSKQDLGQSSYQRNPTAENTMDSNFEESGTNFSVGRDFDESERNFNSSSSAVGGSKTFGVGTGATDVTDTTLHDKTFSDEEAGAGEGYDTEEIFDKDKGDYRVRGGRAGDYGEDRIARH